MLPEKFYDYLLSEGLEQITKVVKQTIKNYELHTTALRKKQRQGREYNFYLCRCRHR